MTLKFRVMKILNWEMKQFDNIEGLSVELLPLLPKPILTSVKKNGLYTIIRQSWKFLSSPGINVIVYPRSISKALNLFVDRLFTSFVEELNRYYQNIDIWWNMKRPWKSFKWEDITTQETKTFRDLSLWDQFVKTKVMNTTYHRFVYRNTHA